MTLSFIDYAIVVAFLALFLWVGIRFKNKANSGLTAFFLGGRNLPWYIAGLSMVATTFAADTPLAVAELVAKDGISGNWLWWSALIGGMMTTFLFAKLWRRSGVLTELELIQLRYGGKPAKMLRVFKSVYLGLFMNGMIIAWVNLAFITLLKTFFGLDTSTLYLLTFGTMVFAAIYTSISGLLGVAITDVVQFFVAMTGSVVLAYLVIDSPEVGGISGLQAALPEEMFAFTPSFETGSTHGLVLTIGAFLTFIGMQWWASWYPGAEPGGGGYIAQRMMSAKDERSAQKATLLFQIAHYCIRPWPWILVALAAVMLYDPSFNGWSADQLTQLDSITQQTQNTSEVMAQLPANMQTPDIAKQVDYQLNTRLGYVYTMVDFLPAGWKGLLLVAFIAAYLSTISTQLNLGASFLVNDFYLPLNPEKRNESGKKLVQYSRVATLLVMLVGMVLTTMVNSISDVWAFIMEAGAGLGAVLILRWFWYRINAWSEITAMLAPFIGYSIGLIFLNDYLGPTYVAQKGPYMFTVLFTTISWVVVTYITQPESKIQLQEFYNRVRPGGSWEKAGIAIQPSEDGLLRYQILAWLTATVMTISILFSIGHFIFGNTIQSILEAGIAIICIGILRMIWPKT